MSSIVDTPVTKTQTPDAAFPWQRPRSVAPSKAIVGPEGVTGNDEMVTRKASEDKPQFAVSLSATNLTLILTILVLVMGFVVVLTRYQVRVEILEKESANFQAFKDQMLETKLQLQNDVSIARTEAHQALEAGLRDNRINAYQTGVEEGRKGKK